MQLIFGAAPTLTRLTDHNIAVTLRTPRIADADEWRRVRLADRELIEPYWDHSPLSWSKRHTRGAWIRECVSARRRMRHGAGLHTVIEVDGHLAGQCDAWIDQYHSRSELGLWVNSQYASAGVGAAAVQLVVAHLFDELGIDRIAAPVAVSNTATARIGERLGFVREGVMRDYMEVGGGRQDHALWSLTRADWPTISAAWGLR